MQWIKADWPCRLVVDLTSKPSPPRSHRLPFTKERICQSLQEHAIYEPEAPAFVTPREGPSMKSSIVVVTLIACLTLEACSSRPREFTPMLITPTASQVQFDAALSECKQLLIAGKLNSSGRAGSAGAGAAAGAATVAGGGTAAAAIGGYAGLAAASATIVLLPFAIIGGAWGMSKIKRAKKEAVIKSAMGGCLRERGYEVAGWSKAVKKALLSRSETSSR
jgi:hypothetical protein